MFTERQERNKSRISQKSSSKLKLKEKESLLQGNQRRCKDQLGVKSNKAEIRGIPWCIGHRTKSMQAKAEGER